MWQEEVLFFDGDTYYSDIVSKINAAVKSVLLECYIFEDDRIGQKILSALKDAVERKVSVKLLVDGIGSRQSISALKSFCETARIDFRVYHPVVFRLNFFSEINKRNHRKSIIIDSATAFVGSFNISEVHSKTFHGEDSWHDAAVFVKGPGVRDIETAFLVAWHKRLRYFKMQVSSSDLVLLNSNLSLRHILYKRFNSRIRRATKRTLITNAYFSPRRKEMQSLMKAARRNILVALCLPKKSDMWVVQALSRLFYPRLLNAGVRIFEFQKTFLHSKTAIIDNWASVGSHNFNHRSFIHDLEVQVVLTHPQNIKLLEDKWNEDLQNSVEIKIDNFPAISLWNRIITTLAFWFRYWM